MLVCRFFIMLDTWSFSKLSEFEKCKYRTFLLHVARVPEPPRELRPGQTEHANDRGSRIHDAAERFVRAQADDLPYELKSFEQEFLRLRQLFKLDMVSLEGEWGYDENWTPMPWRGEWRLSDQEETDYDQVDALPKWGKAGQVVMFNDQFFYWHPCWHRSKLDAMVMPDPHHAVVIDYKTGKKFGNEIKHAEQLQLYAVVAFMRFPQLEEVTTELWYVDQNEITSVTVSREKALRSKSQFTRRGMAMTTNTEWPPNPSIWTCRYCDYGKTGDCKVSAKEQFVVPQGRRGRR